MKNYVSYVIQDEEEHHHYAEVIDFEFPAYSYSSDPQVSDILKWANQKQSTLKKSQNLVVINMYKV